MAMSSNVNVIGDILRKIPVIQNQQVAAADNRLNDLKLARENAETNIAIMKARENALTTAKNFAIASGDQVLLEKVKDKEKVFAQKAIDDFDNLFK